MPAYETSDIKERVILAAVENERGATDAESCLDELGQLVLTSGGSVAGRLIQKREQAHPGHYLGKGKLDELKELIVASGANGVVCDDELSGNQIRNMEEKLDTKIMDRTMVILDIFAECARSAEGKAQVELAQLNYRASRLTGLGKSLSRLGGGIGTRGPGETKLETDRRHIRGRIAELTAELKEIEKQREVQRGRRERNNTGIVSAVGYTNAGKSSLMNMLTDAGAFVSPRLFATLDTATRRLELPGGPEILLTDTVGFIAKLPHNLVKAFRATLEELAYADILLHVVDVSSPYRAEQTRVVYDTLKELNCADKPVITVFNKTDLLADTGGLSDPRALKTVFISALTGDGKDDLLGAIEEVFQTLRKKIKLLIPFGKGRELSLLHQNAEIISEEHTENGTLITAYADADLAGRLSAFIRP